MTLHIKKKQIARLIVLFTISNTLHYVRLSSNSSKETNFSNKTLGGLKLIRMNINSIRSKELDLLAFLEVHQPQAVTIQETNIDCSIATSALFPETCQYNVFRKDRNLHGGGVMLLVHKGVVGWCEGAE